jgi:hypothetical protein
VITPADTTPAPWQAAQNCEYSAAPVRTSLADAVTTGGCGVGVLGIEMTGRAAVPPRL